MPFPSSTVARLLQAQAERIPAAPAILAPRRRPLTYGSLWRHVRRAADALQAAGLGRDDRVVLVVPNGPEMAVACLAAMTGAVCAPLNPACSAQEFEQYTTDVGARALIVAAGMPSPARDLARLRGLPVLELAPVVDAEAGAFTLTGGEPASRTAGPPARPDDVALALHTAGTTSRPRIVPLTHANLCASAHNISRALDLREADRCLNVMPLFHVHGLVGALLASLVAGASVVCAPGFSPEQFLDWLADSDATWYTAVPTIHQAILARMQTAPGAWPRLRFIRSTSASLPPPVLAELEERFGSPVIEAYGTTEASMITCNPLPPRVRKRGSVGVAAGPELVLLDGLGRPQRPGQAGEIAVRGPTVIAGYENDPGTNASVFAGGWFRTGDQGYLDADGYLFITGRVEETINRGGESVSPQEIDAVLLEHPAVAQAVTFAVPHPRLGEDIAAAVVLRPGVAATADDVRAFAATRVASFKVPQQIILAADLPRSPTGKLQRIGLSDRLGLTGPSLVEGPGDGAPLAPVEEITLGLWRQTLAVARIGRDDNFFALGGDSILATQLLSRVLTLLGVEIAFRSFFQTPTVAGMARAIEAARAASPRPATPSLAPSPQPGPVPLSYAQQRLWFLDRLGLSGHAYHVLEAVHVRGDLHVAALADSLCDLQARHEITRARVVDRDGQAHQEIGPPDRHPLRVVDLGESPSCERDARILALALAEMERRFDLTRGPLLRATLARLAADEHVLLLTMHHVVCDGWSYAVLCRDLRAFYGARTSGTPASLPELPVQYADYVRWERQVVAGDALAAHLDYWKRRLDGLARLDLPTDAPRPRVPGFRGARQPLAFSPQLTRALKTLSGSRGATPFMVLLAALQCVLHRYSGQDDVAVGTLVAHRTRAELEGLVGLFVNILVLRTDFTGDPTFLDLLARVRDTALDAYDHQDLPFEKLVEELHPRRDLGRHPLVDVLFIYQNTPRARLELTGLTVSPLEIDPGTAKLDLTLELTEAADGLRGWIEYSTDLFDPPTIARMAGHLHALVEAIVSDPARRVSRLPLLTAEERTRLVEGWNDTAADYPRNASIPELFRRQVGRTPHRMAFIESGQSLTYEQLDRAANQLAQHLGTLGVAPGVLVGVCLPRSLDAVVAMLGILKAGGVYVPLDPSYPAERLAFIVADGRLAVVVTCRAATALFSGPGPHLVCLDGLREELAGGRGDDPDVRVGAEDLAYVIYTSGSTGRPKGVAAPHRQVVNRLAWMWRAYPFVPDEVACQKTALSFVDSIWECLGALLQGVPTVIVPDAIVHDPTALVRVLAEARVTRLWLVPSLLRVLLDRFPDLERRLPTLKFWVTSGEALPLDLYRRFEACLPSSVLYNLYGISEVWDVTWQAPPLRPGPVLRVPVGRPIANVRVYLLDEHVQPTPVGVPGQIHVGGDAVSRGYLNRPALTAERFIPDPFSREPGARLYRTGDLARYLADGTIDFLGRADDQVKLRGYRIEPREVELALERHPAVGQAVVTVREDVAGEPCLVAYVVGARQAVPPWTALRRFLQAHVPAHMVPSALVQLDQLPLTPSGKVDRRALPPPDRDRPDLPTGFVDPRRATEATVAGIWAQVLGLDRIGRHDGFFDLGGHSLLALQVLARIQAATGVEVPLTRFFETPTVAEIADFIDGAHATELVPAPIPRVSRRRALPASYAQERLWSFDRLAPRSPASNIAYAIRLDGPLDHGVLERSLAELRARHEILRTTFRVVNRHLVQVIASSARASIPVVDLRSLPGAAREAEIRRLARLEAHRPFDLARGPLVRLHLWRLAEEQHVLVVTMHHIVSDGWSMGIFIRELGAGYRAGSEGRPADLPSPAIQYADFAAWERRTAHSGGWRAQLAYWRRQLRGPLRPLRFPAARRPRQSHPAPTGREPFFVSVPLAAALAASSRREGSTPFMMVVAGLKVLLHAYTEMDDLRVAAFLARRQRRELEGVMGLFSDAVILRTSLAGNPSCGEIVRRVRATTLEALAHCEIPFEVVARTLERERGLPRASLSQVLVIWQNAFRLSGEDAGGALGFLEMDQDWLAPEGIPTTFDLIFEVREQRSGLLGSCVYNTRVLDASAVRRLLADLQTVLHTVATAPGQRLRAVRGLLARTADGAGVT